LLGRLRVRSHVKFVLGKFPRDTRHVFGGPCKDVLILTEEIDELAFLFAVEAGADGHALGGVSRIQWYLPGVLGRLKRAFSN